MTTTDMGNSKNYVPPGTEELAMVDDADEWAAAEYLLRRFIAETTTRDQADYPRRMYGGPNHVDQAHHLLTEWNALSEGERQALISFFPDQLANDPHVDASSRAACHAAVQRARGNIDPVPWTLTLGYGQVYGSMDPAEADIAVAHIVYPDDSVGRVEAFDALRASLASTTVSEDVPEDASVDSPPPKQAAIVIVLPHLSGGFQLLEDGSRVVPPPMPVFHPVYDFLTTTAAAAPGTKLVMSTHESHRADWGIIDNGWPLLGSPGDGPRTYSEQRVQRGLPKILYSSVLSQLSGIPPHRGAPPLRYQNPRTATRSWTIEGWRNPYSSRAKGPYRSVAPGMN